MSLRNAEGGHARKLIDETIEYRKTGKLPACAKCDLPTLVVSQTLGDREHGKESSTDTVRKVAMDDAAAEQQARDAALREANSRQIAADNAAINRLLRGEPT